MPTRIDIKVQAVTDDWVRPADWLVLPSVTSGSNKFAGLYAVYELLPNVLTIQVNGATNSLIYWGDGTTQSASNTINYTKTYSYASTLGRVSVDEYGRNYKQVIVEIDLNATTTGILIDRNNTGTVINNSGNTGWLDIAVDCATMTTFGISSLKKSRDLQRIVMYTHAVNNPNSIFSNCQNLRILDADFPLASNFQSAFLTTGNFTKSNGDGIDITNSVASQVNTTFSASMIKKLGNLSATAATVWSNTLVNCWNLETVGAIKAPANTTFVAFASGCNRLRSIGTITTSSALLSIQNMFSNCAVLEEVVFTECSGVTTTTGAFSACYGLKKVLLPNITVGFTIAQCLLEAVEINAMFTALGTAAGSQTITITGNPGAATCDVTIATSKGWTVTL